MTHPNCDHGCTSNCRREGCNCLCGEYHDSMTQDEIIEALKDEVRDTQIDTVKMLLRMYVQGHAAYHLAATIVDTLMEPLEKEVVQETKRITQHND